MDFVVPPLVRAAVTGSPLIGPMERPLRCNGRTPSCPTHRFRPPLRNVFPCFPPYRLAPTAGSLERLKKRYSVSFFAFHFLSIITNLPPMSSVDGLLRCLLPPGVEEECSTHDSPNNQRDTGLRPQVCPRIGDDKQCYEAQRKNDAQNGIYGHPCRGILIAANLYQSGGRGKTISNSGTDGGHIYHPIEHSAAKPWAAQ